jgi:DNA-binding XRE family transcriptional regulator
MEAHKQEMLNRIGTRVRAERNRMGLSLAAMAKKVGISKMTLHRIETGATSPSITCLTEIAFHLKQSVETLIKEGDPNVILLKKNQQETIFDPNIGIRVITPRGIISDRITMIGAELKKGTVIETHTNRGFEWAYIIEGKAVVDVGNHRYPLEPGDAIFYDAHFPHSIRMEETVRFIELFIRDE